MGKSPGYERRTGEHTFLTHFINMRENCSKRVQVCDCKVSDSLSWSRVRGNVSTSCILMLSKGTVPGSSVDLVLVPRQPLSEPGSHGLQNVFESNYPSTTVTQDSSDGAIGWDQSDEAINGSAQALGERPTQQKRIREQKKHRKTKWRKKSGLSP